MSERGSGTPSGKAGEDVRGCERVAGDRATPTAPEATPTAPEASATAGDRREAVAGRRQRPRRKPFVL